MPLILINIKEKIDLKAEPYHPQPLLKQEGGQAQKQTDEMLAATESNIHKTFIPWTDALNGDKGLLFFSTRGCSLIAGLAGHFY